MNLLLASASPRRRELLSALVPAFEVVPADVEEVLGTDAVADAKRLAAAKAERVIAVRADALVVAADTIVFDDDRLYGKPLDADDARKMLRALGGRDHCVVTGVAVAHAGVLTTDASLATVVLGELGADDMERYIASGVPLDKAGAYAIQDENHPVVAGLEGCYCNVMGLPLLKLKGLLERAGVPCADPAATFTRCAGCPDR